MKRHVLLALVAPVSWGTTYITVTELLPDDRPLLVAAGRVTPAGLVLLAIAHRTGWWAPRGREWGRSVALALANFALFFPLLSVAVYRLPGGVAAAAGGLQPLLVAGLAWPLIGSRPPLRVLVVGAGAAVGVAMVVLRPGAAFDPVGIVAAVAAAISFATGVVLTKRFGPPSHRIAAAGWQLLISSTVLVPLALTVEGVPPVPTATHVVGFAYLSLGTTALAFVLWFGGIARLPVAAPPLLGLAAPVTGAGLGWIVLGETLSWSQLLGFALTLGAIAHGALVGARVEAGARSDGPAPEAEAGNASLSWQDRRDVATSVTPPTSPTTVIAASAASPLR